MDFLKNNHYFFLVNHLRKNKLMTGTAFKERAVYPLKWYRACTNERRPRFTSTLAACPRTNPFFVTIYFSSGHLVRHPAYQLSSIIYHKWSKLSTNYGQEGSNLLRNHVHISFCYNLLLLIKEKLGTVLWWFYEK